jgi:hypothetical protein
MLAAGEAAKFIADSVEHACRLSFSSQSHRGFSPVGKALTILEPFQRFSQSALQNSTKEQTVKNGSCNVKHPRGHGAEAAV